MTRRLARTLPLAVAAVLAGCATAGPAAAHGPAGPGALDRTFSHDGLLRDRFGAYAVRTLAAAGAPDGSTTVLAEGEPPGIVARYTRRGRLDRSFGDGGVLRGAALQGGGNDGFVAIARTPDGGFVLAGHHRADLFAVLKLDSHGRPDPSFGTDGLAVVPTGHYLSVLPEVLVRPDGSIIVAALAWQNILSPQTIGLLALDRTGKPVDSFGTGGTVFYPAPRAGPASYRDGSGSHLLLTPAGRILIVSSTGREGRVELAALRPNGFPDPTFAQGGVREIGTSFAGGLSDVALDDAGRILLAGTDPGGRRNTAGVVRLGPNGDVDPTFGDGGLAATDRHAPSAGGLAIGSLGRVALALTLSRVRGHGRHERVVRRPGALLLSRDGRPVRGFGRRGVVMVRGAFHGPATADVPVLDPFHRLTLAGSVGRGLPGFREDYGHNYVAVERLRTLRPLIAVGRRARVSRRGVVRLSLRCRRRFPPCFGALRLRGHRLRATRKLQVPRGRHHLRIRLGRRAARLARRHRHVRVAVDIREFGPSGPVSDRLAVSVRLRRR